VEAKEAKEAKLPTSLEYQGKSLNKDELAGRPHIVVYDTQGHSVFRYTLWDGDRPELAVFKAEVVNVLEFLSDVYNRSVVELANTAGEIAKKLNKKTSDLPPDVARGLCGKVQMRLEDSIRRVSEWCGSGHYSAVVPYCFTAYLDKENKTISFKDSRPMVNGFLVYAVYE
jgi:hypothetical protein